MAEVHEINSIDELADHRLVWNYLLAETRGASFFHTLDWLLCFWRHFGQRQKLRVLLIESRGKPIGIVPFCVRTEKYRVGRVRVLTYPLDNWGHGFSPLGRNQAASMMLAMHHLRHTPRDWDMIDLPTGGSLGGDGGRLSRAMRIAGFSPSKESTHTSSLVQFTGDWDQFLASKTSKHRHEIRRKLRRADERGDIQFIRHRPTPTSAGDGDPRWDLYDMCEQVAAESWQAHADDGNTLSSQSVREFLREAHANAARLGMIDMNLILIAGEPAAFGYNYHCDGRLFGLRIGYAARHRQAGVGNLLLLRTIQDSFARNDRVLDLGAGEWPFKKVLRTDVTVGHRLTHLPLVSLRSQAVRLSRWAKRQLAAQGGVEQKSASA